MDIPYLIQYQLGDVHKLKLTIISHGPFAHDGQHYIGNELLGKYIDKLAPYFSEIIICAYIIQKEAQGYEEVSQYQLTSQNVTFLELPMAMTHNPGILRKLWQLIKASLIIFANIKKWELIYIFIPSYPSLVTFWLNKIFSKPFFIYVAGDWTGNCPHYFKWHGWRKKVFYPIYAFLNRKVESQIVDNSPLIIVAGRGLFEKYYSPKRSVVQTVPMMNLSKEDFFFREDTCQTTPIKCLFVGSLIPVKGLIYLLEAMKILRNQDYSITLNIVGMGHQYEELRKLSNHLNVKDVVEFSGYIPNEEIFQLYRKSDIFVLPTLMEGFPRVLYEAMAQSIPIVTTNVGGIPWLMKNGQNAVVIPPKSPESIAESILKLVTDGNLRRRLIKNGYATVQNILNRSTEEQIDSLLKTHFPVYRKWVRIKNIKKTE